MQELLNIKEVRERLRQIILNEGLNWNDGLLPDGKIAKWMFDLREIFLTPEGSNLTSFLVYEKLKELEFDMIGGPSIAAEPLVASLLLHFYKKGRCSEGFIIRNKPTNFGLRKKIEGPVKKGKKVVLIDDSINSGLGLADSINALKQEGCDIVKILTIIDFCKTGRNKLSEGGYDVDSIFSLEDFGLDLNKHYQYNRVNKLTEIKITDGKGKILEKLNKILGEEILDFQTYKTLILVAYKEGSVYCFNQDNYEVKWNLEFGEQITAPIIVDEDMAIISASSGLKRAILFFVSIEDGKIIGSINTKGKINSAPLLHKNFCFLGSDDKKFYCVDKREKRILWTFQLDSGLSSTPAIDNNLETIYFNTIEGYVYALDFAGKLIWKKHLSNKFFTSPLVFEDSVITNSEFNIIFCLDKNNGKIKWFNELKNKAFSINVLFNELLVGCANGYLILFDVKNGKLMECFKLFNQDIKEININNGRLIVKDEDGKNYFVKT